MNRPRGRARAALWVLALAPASCDAREPSAGAPAGPTIWGYPFAVDLESGAVTFLRHVSADDRIELSVTRDVGPEVAAELVAGRVGMYESVFARRPTGYPGQHTRYVELPERFRPRRFRETRPGGSFEYFVAFATANFVHGAGADDLAAYRSLYGLAYCEGRRTLVEIDYFTGTDDEERIQGFVARVTCDLGDG